MTKEKLISLCVALALCFASKNAISDVLSGCYASRGSTYTKLNGETYEKPSNCKRLYEQNQIVGECTFSPTERTVNRDKYRFNGPESLSGSLTLSPFPLTYRATQPTTESSEEFSLTKNELLVRRVLDPTKQKQPDSEKIMQVVYHYEKVAQSNCDSIARLVDRPKSATGIETLGSGPDVSPEWAADACGMRDGVISADRSTATKVQYFDPMKASEVNIRAVVPQSATLYPVEITYKLQTSPAYEQVKKYMTGTRKGFIYKSAFGKYECYSQKEM